ncbi:MAG: hypothetical protein WC764_02380 [Candidatus Paceibacterota bacterium]|jgi:hypothetical protein
MKFFERYRKIIGSAILVAILFIPIKQALAVDGDSAPSASTAAAGVRWAGRAGAAGSVATGAISGAAAGAWFGVPGAIVGGVLGAASGALSSAATLATTEAVSGAIDGDPGFLTTRVVGALVSMIRGFASWAMITGASMLDKAVLMNFATDFNQIKAISIGWKIIRDIMNMLFIFIMLYIAIGTILQINGVDAKKMITSLILAALFVNFSMFVTKIGIDASNILALEFYNKITVDNTRSISNTIINGLNIAEKAIVDEKKESDLTQELYRNIFIIILYIFLARFFLMGALMFIGRMMAFAFVLMFSPFAVAGYIVPQWAQYEKEWLGTLTGQMLFAPFYLFIVYFVAQLIYLTDGAKFVVAESAGSPIAIAGYINYIIIIGLLTIGLDKAKKFSGEVGGVLVDYGKKAFTYAAGAALGGIALGGQGILGSAGSFLGDPKRMANWANSSNPIARRVGNLASKPGVSNALQGLGANTYDPRNIPGVGNLLNQAAGAVTGGGGLGTAVAAGGMAAIIAANRKKKAEQAKNNINIIKETNRGETNKPAREKGVADYVSKFSGTEHEEVYNQLSTGDKAVIENRYDNDLTEKIMTAGVDDATEVGKIKDRIMSGALTGDEKKNVADIKSKMGKGEQVDDKYKDAGAYYRATQLKINDVKTKMDADDIKKIGDAVKGIKSKETSGHLKKALGAENPDSTLISSLVKGLKRSDVTGLGDETLSKSQVATNLKQNQLDAIALNNDISEETKEAIAKEIGRSTGNEEVKQYINTDKHWRKIQNLSTNPPQGGSGLTDRYGRPV